MKGLLIAVGLTLALVVTPGGAHAQDLADLDYEDLSFRGMGFEVGYLFPTRVERAVTYGGRLDLGYLGAGVRFVPRFTYWSAPFRGEEVRTLEERVESLVSQQTGGIPVVVDLGTIEWTDYALGFDTHFVWRTPVNLLTYAGVGLSAHVLDGRGAAIEGTFIEDLLDSVSAGFNVHLGLEYPLLDRLRLQTQGRYEFLEDMRYFQITLGAQVLWGALVPGEERR